MWLQLLSLKSGGGELRRWQQGGRSMLLPCWLGGHGLAGPKLAANPMWNPLPQAAHDQPQDPLRALRRPAAGRRARPRRVVWAVPLGPDG